MKTYRLLKIGVLTLSALFLAAGFARAAAPAVVGTPNIVYILCDDLGYGDVHCLNPERGKIPTPNLDQLRSEGMAFTDCHSSSAVCSPSRYSILTGRYSWRSRLQSGVLAGDGAPLIAPSRLTVPELLQQHGYATAGLGKWHLGLRYNKQDYTQPITDGPLQHGFDSYFGIPASLDMPPFVYFENNRFTEVPSVIKTFMRAGPAGPNFEAVDVLPKLMGKAVDYLGAHATNSQPLFLYLALPAPHTPLVPNQDWQGKSPLGTYADYVMETDWAIGQVLKAIDRAGLHDSTLVMLASDNGCAPYVGVHKLEAMGHYPSAQFRGYKADIWDGGHRIPFLVRWPGRVKAGSQSDQVVCLGDFIATCADILGAKLPDNAGEDSVSLLPALLGTDRAPLHEAIVNHSNNGRFAIRQGNWKLEFCPGSGGWAQPLDAAAFKQGLPVIQLYNMHDDVGEKVNLQAKDLQTVTNLTLLLEKYVADGRSTPGARQTNDVPVDIWKKQLNDPQKAQIANEKHLAVGD